MNSKKITGFTLGFVVVVLGVYFIVARLSESPTWTDTELGLRKTSIEGDDNAILLDVNYSGVQTGESIVLDRSFENAPPLISHDIEGMYPITADMNMCLSCHDKAVAEVLVVDQPNLKPAPASHYFSIRTEADTGDITKAETGDMVSNERFNCDQCHVVQTDAKPLIGNTFKADFSSENAKKMSNFKDTFNQGVVEEKIKTYGGSVN